MTRADGAEPGEIARRLTAAQRRALLWLPADGSARSWGQLGSHSPNALTMRVLERFRLAVRQWDQGAGCMLAGATPLGQAVRAAIAQQEAAADAT